MSLCFGLYTVLSKIDGFLWNQRSGKRRFTHWFWGSNFMLAVEHSVCRLKNWAWQKSLARG